MHVEPHLARRGANYSPLSPVHFLDRAVSVFPERLAIIWRDRRFTYGQFGAMVRRMADVLEARGIGSGDVVSIMCQNRPEMLAAHYAVPLLGATLNSINTRLDESTVSYILEHSESRLLICDETCESI
jgi:fatty-acyl-CoA synthase